MADAREIDILNGLLGATRNSPLAHLTDSAMFLTSAGADEAEAVQRMIVDEQEHAAALAELMLSMGEAPRPAQPDAHTAELHYLEFHFLLPRLLIAKESLLAAYESARARLGGSPRALEAVTRLTARQREHAATLRALVGRSSAASAPTP